MSDPFVRTVRGDVRPDALGPVNYHEHFFQVSPLLPGDELCDEDAGIQEARQLVASGFPAVVDATPLGLGRKPLGLRRVSAEAAVSIVATTGRHRDAHYSDQDWILELGAERMGELFTADLVEGMPIDDRALAPGAGTVARSDVRAGVLKAGIDYWTITAAEREAIAAVGIAHRATGAPVMVHTEYCTAVDLALDLLEAAGVPAERVVIAHADRTPDAGLHSAIAARGAYVGYDGAGRYKEWPDSVLLGALEALVAAGAGDRILLGADVARSSRYRAYGGVPGLEYLGRAFVPRLRERVGTPAVETITTVNAARWLTWSPTQARS
ncbi:aryldialkylphosphatase [Microbacterium sp. zg.B48]|uniref:phosphotriesterase family protein n=1 Tax=Microbacterium sp. zg.B48 TaxID=2969408 RepID=UPI00214B3F51|nr:aryldialkylphosphatase [Microbacterium sp. zg.B48]MCR2762825.1 aryldialkylphosphatase [Microbacterium sp. zg.B48]